MIIHGEHQDIEIAGDARAIFLRVGAHGEFDSNGPDRPHAALTALDARRLAAELYLRASTAGGDGREWDALSLRHQEALLAMATHPEPDRDEYESYWDDRLDDHCEAAFAAGARDSRRGNSWIMMWGAGLREACWVAYRAGYATAYIDAEIDRADATE
jgi:hypothetical protein